jgi:class 3 adenylate cyclase
MTEGGASDGGGPEPPVTAADPQPAPPAPASRPASATHGFLFADLRGYTAYIDREGAAAAAALLERFRSLVRTAVAAHHGAEIRTEGDSFYITFPRASPAVACALDIVAATAADAADHPVDPIRVGVGVHAGEALETPDGPVGTAVNIAARLCAIAAPGEVVVSDTVRSLTRSVGDAQFIAMGRRTVKGLDEPLTVYRAVPAGTPLPAPRRAAPSRRLALAGGLVALPAVAAIGVVLVLGSNASPETAAGPSSSASMEPSHASASPRTSAAASLRPSATPSRVIGPAVGAGRPKPLADRGRWSPSAFTFPFSIDLDSGQGWSAWEDVPDRALVSNDVTFTTVTFAPLQAVLDPPCADSEPKFLGARPEDLMDWLESRDWLETSDRRPFAAGRKLGQAIRVTIPADAAWTCPDGGTPSTAIMFLMAGGEAMGEGKDAEFWIAALVVGDRTVTAITRLCYCSTVGLDRVLPDAEEVLESIEFAES